MSLTAAIEADAEVLVAGEPRLATEAPLQVEVWGGGYGSLVRLILGQLVSIEAADAMWSSLCAAVGSVTPKAIRDADDALLRRCGFTARKAEYSRRIGAAGIDFAHLDRQPDAAIANQLVSLPGIGRWTADCYLVFALGRRDVFPAGDLALRIGWQELESDERPPTEAKLREIAERWSPRRTAAAYLIWAQYLRRRGRV